MDQVVHGYGDICQAVTELADEKRAAVAADESRTFNRLLDDAVSDAVSSFGRHRDAAIKGQGEDEQRVLIDILVKAFDALKIGNIGLRGPTGALLESSLGKLRKLIDKSLPPASAPPKP